MGCKSDMKSTNGTCHLFGSCLVSLQYKKQYNTSISTTEDDYITVDSYCVQGLWLKKQFLDYDLRLECVPIKGNSTSIISLNKNLLLLSRIKHIEIRHHFLRDHVEKGDFF